MENEKWSWFAGGVVLGLLLGLGIAGGYFYTQLQAERARAMESEAIASEEAARSRDMEAEARRNAERAERLLEESRKQLEQSREKEKKDR